MVTMVARQVPLRAAGLAPTVEQLAAVAVTAAAAPGARRGSATGGEAIFMRACISHK